MLRHSISLALALMTFSPALRAQMNVDSPKSATPGQSEIVGHDQLVLMTSARSHYYNLVAKRISGFHCDVEIDWNAFFRSVTGKPLSDDDPFLIYLKKTHVHLKDSVRAIPELTWTNTAQVPADKERAAATLKSSYSAIIDGFLRALNPSLNGNLIPLSPTAVHRSANGFVIDNRAGPNTDTITLNQALTVTHISSVTPQITSEMETSFTDVAGSLMLTHVDETYRQPISAPPIRFLLDASFAAIGTYQLPRALTVTFPNAGVFKMNLTSCVTERSP